VSAIHSFMTFSMRRHWVTLFGAGSVKFEVESCRSGFMQRFGSSRCMQVHASFGLQPFSPNRKCLYVRYSADMRRSCRFPNGLELRDSNRPVWVWVKDGEDINDVMPQHSS
jgi:hypothetical protein